MFILQSEDICQTAIFTCKCSCEEHQHWNFITLYETITEMENK